MQNISIILNLAFAGKPGLWQAKCKMPLPLFAVAPSLALVALFFPGLLWGQVLINEISTSNKNQVADNFGEYEDWIELYNAGATTADISGYFLGDDVSNPTEWQVPNGTLIPPGGHLLIWCSGRDGVFANALHSEFKLTQMRQEDVLLADPTGTIIDQFALTVPTRRNHSRGRQNDGAPNWRIFANPTPGFANGTQNSYIGYVPKVVFDQPAGFYPLPGVALGLSCPDPSAEIRYTLDGSEPNIGSPLYQGTLFLTLTQCVRARAFVANPLFLASFTETNTYLIDVSHTLPVISLSGDYNTLFGGFGGEIRNALEYFDEFEQQQFEMEGDTRGHGNDSWNFDQKGIRFYTRDQYGYENNIQYPIFKTSPRQEYDVIIIKAAGSDNFPGANNFWNLPSCHLRDAFSHTLAEEGNLQLDLRRLQHCIVYINGTYWGLYEIRERVDADYTNYYYSQEEPDVDMIKFWGGIDLEYGSDTAYYNLVDFINNNSMADPANYAYVGGQLDMMSLIDYFIISTFTVNSDWLNWNTMWWRGREAPGIPWRYALWDNDNTFDLGQNYTGLPTTNFDNDPCATDDAFPADNTITHSQVLSRLFDNPDFFSMYISRYADLVNTVFSCDNMIQHLDSLLAIITPEMPAQVARWGGTMPVWQANVQYLRDQILGRCNFINGGIVDCYQPTVTGPHTITVRVEPPLSGNVVFNTLPLNAYPWTGNYFGGVDIDLRALANAGWAFDYWELDQNFVTPTVLDSIAEMVLNAPDTLIAHFRNLGVSIAPNAPTLCEGESVTLIADGGNLFSWTESGDPTVLGTDDSLTVAPFATTVYVVSNGFATDTVTVTVNALPAPILPANSSICSGENLIFDPQVPGAAYLWQDGATTAAYSANTSGAYSVTVTLNNCTASAGAQLLVNPLPVVELAGPFVFCAGENQLLDATNTGATYLWQDGSTGATLLAEQSGLFVVEVLRNGCRATDSVLVTVNPLPVFDLGADRFVCVGETVLLDAGIPGANYLWQDGSTGATFGAIQSGSYRVEVLLNGCRSIDSAQVTVYELPIVSLGPDSTFCVGEPVLLDAGNPGGNYLWQDGSTVQSYEAEEAGMYAVTVTLNNCSATDEVNLSQELCGQCETAVPNAFTPNGDGKNDVFLPLFADCEALSDFRFVIFDRWGNIVFETNDPLSGWSGGEYPRDVYLWFLGYEAVRDGQRFRDNKQGEVILVR